MLAPSGAEDKESLPVNETFVLRGHDGPVLGVRLNKAGTYCLSCGKASHIPACLTSLHAAPAHPIQRSHRAFETLGHPTGPGYQAMEPSQGESDQDIQWSAPPPD